MIYQPVQDGARAVAIDESQASSGPTTAHLPVGLGMLEQAAAALRAFLRRHGLDHYVIFHGSDFEFADLDELLPRLCPGATWEAAPLTPGGEQPRALDGEGDAAALSGVGVIRLEAFDFVLGRWNWLDAQYNLPETTVLGAAPDAAAYRRLRDACVDLRRRAERPVWEIVRSSTEQETRPRTPLPWSNLSIAPAVRSRIEAEVTGFFKPEVAELYRSMDVPYRRGVLLYGPPGNGKTSIVKAIATAMPDVYAMILRPDDTLGDRALKSIFKRWRRHAPALLVIEDLDHLLKDYINLSHFLNQV